MTAQVTNTVSASDQTGTNVTSFQPSAALTCNPGDIIDVTVTSNSGSMSVSGVNDGAAYTPVGSVNFSAQSRTQARYTRLVTVAGTFTPVASCSSGNGWGITAAQITGAAGVDTAAGTSGFVSNTQASPGTGNGAVTTASGTPGTEPGLLLTAAWVGSFTGTNTCSAFSGTEPSGTPGTTSAHLGETMVEDQRYTALTGQTGTFTLSGNSAALTTGVFYIEANQLAETAIDASTATGSLSTAIKMAAAAASVSSVSAQLTNWTTVTLTAPLYSSTGGILDPNFWLDSVPGVGAVVYYDGTNITIEPDGEIVSISNNCQAVCGFYDPSGNWAQGLVVITPGLVGYANIASQMQSSLATAIQLATALNDLTSSTGQLNSQIIVQAAATSLTTAVGALTTAIKLAAAAVDASTATGFLGDDTRMAGILADVSNASGLLNTQINMLAAAADATSAAGALATKVVLLASALTTTSAIGTLRTGDPLNGQAVSAAVASAGLVTQVRLATAAHAVVSAAGALSTHIQALGVAVSSTTAAGALTIPKSLAGALSDVSTATGQLQTMIQLGGTVWAIAYANGTFSGSIVMDGQITSMAAAAAQLSAPGSPVGMYTEDPYWLVTAERTDTTQAFAPLPPSQSVILSFDMTPQLNPGEFLQGRITVSVECTQGTDANLPGDLLAGVAAFNGAQTVVEQPVTNGIDGDDYYFTVTSGVATATANEPFKTVTCNGLLQVRT